MLHRLGRMLAGALLLGCSPSTMAPSEPAAPPPAANEVAAATPTDREPGQSLADRIAPHVATPKSRPPAPAPAAQAPQQVETDVNDDYEAQTNPKRWAARFEKEGREVFDHRDEILGALGLHEGMAVADVGAGTGLFTLALAEKVGAKGTVFAVDVQAYFLDHIGQKAKKAELRNVQLVRATQHSAKLAEGSVDLAIMCDSYHHVEHPAAYLASLKAALRPGGRLVIVDYIAIEGQSEAWMLEHVRATPQAFRAEIESAGFRFVRAHEGVLKENFFFEFERP